MLLNSSTVKKGLRCHLPAVKESERLGLNVTDKELGPFWVPEQNPVDLENLP